MGYPPYPTQPSRWNGDSRDPFRAMALAQREVELHRRRVATYEAIQAELARDPAMAFELATVQMGLRYERLSVAYWENLAAHPFGVASTSEPV